MSKIQNEQGQESGRQAAEACSQSRQRDFGQTGNGAGHVYFYGNLNRWQPTSLPSIGNSGHGTGSSGKTNPIRTRAPKHNLSANIKQQNTPYSL
jgi:hypothetical protein